MPRPNLLSLFDNFERFGKDLAFVQKQGYRRRTVSYQQLLAAAGALSDRLASLNIGSGDRVLLWGANSAEWVCCFWAIQKRDAVVVPMDAGASPTFVAQVIRDSRIQLILHDSDHVPPDAGPPALRYDSVYDEVFPPLSAPIAAHTPSRSDLAEILFTSGTTSDPRGVLLTHGNFLANLEPIEQGVEEYRRYEKWFHPLRFVSLVPLSHVFGQMMSLFVPPLLGATVVFEDSPNPSEILRTVKRERATALVCVPRMLDALHAYLLREIEARGWNPWFDRSWGAAQQESFLRRAWRFRRIHRLFGWKFWAFISGGSALSSSAEEFFKRLGFAVVQGYGMTETASLISLNHPFRAAEGSVGKILPGREFRLAEDGEILVRGENVSGGYLRDGVVYPGENSGWLRTGDLGELDANGNLKFRGRKKNVIVTPAGLNIYPEDLESALRRQSEIRDVVVVPIEVAANAEPCAILLLNALQTETPDIADGTARHAIDAANSSLAEFQRIRRWILWPDPDFPRTPTGKPRLGVLTDFARQKTSASSTTNAAALSAVDPSADNSLPSDETLAAMSSLDRVDLLARLEQRHQVELNETQFAKATTAADLRQLLAQPGARRTDYVYPSWAQWPIVRALRLAIYYLLTWPATLLLGHPRVVGRDRLASLKGPVLFVSNHITRRADIGLILFALPARYRHRLTTAMGGETLLEFRHPPAEYPLLKRFLWRLSYFLVVSLFNVFPLPQLSGFRGSFQFAGESVDRGYSILVFPEGIINDRPSADMVAFQPGIGILAEQLRIPVVPIRLDGVWQMKQRRRRWAHSGEITVRFGAPVTLSEMPAAEAAAHLQSLVKSL